MDENNPQIFPTDDEYIEQMASDSDAQLQKLLETPRPFITRFGGRWVTHLVHGTPKWNLLPHNISYLAKELGFRPICFHRTGMWLIPMIKAPQWIGPEGFVLLERVDKKQALEVTMSDGSHIAIVNYGEAIEGPRRRLLSSGNFKTDYDWLLQLVQDYMFETGTTPIYIATPAGIKANARVFIHLHRKPSMMLQFMLAELFMVVAIVVWIVMFAHGKGVSF